MYPQAISCQYGGCGIEFILPNPDVCNRKRTPLKAGLPKLLCVVLKLGQSEQSNLSLISHTCAQARSDCESELSL